jgi:hypothetical protein
LPRSSIRGKQLFCKGKRFSFIQMSAALIIGPNLSQKNLEQGMSKSRVSQNSVFTRKSGDFAAKSSFRKLKLSNEDLLML